MRTLAPSYLEPRINAPFGFNLKLPLVIEVTPRIIPGPRDRTRRFNRHRQIKSTTVTMEDQVQAASVIQGAMQGTAARNEGPPVAVPKMHILFCHRSSPSLCHFLLLQPFLNLHALETFSEYDELREHRCIKPILPIHQLLSMTLILLFIDPTEACVLLVEVWRDL